MCAVKEDKKSDKALNDLISAKVEIAELKAQVAMLEGKLALKDKELEQEQVTKSAQIELAASMATLEAQKNLTTQLNEAYNNGLKFAQMRIQRSLPRGAPRAAATGRLPHACRTALPLGTISK